MLMRYLIVGIWLCLCPSLYAAPSSANFETATFAGGCFWCMQPPFDILDGVISTTVGYIGGHVKNPNYQQVSAGETGHAEAVQIIFDPAKINYRELVEVFWRNIDPTALNRQFKDIGDQYRSAIFYHSEQQRHIAEESKFKLIQSERYDKPIVTAITQAGAFYVAEEYHQSYYIKNPLRYKYYRYHSGRDQYLTKIWN